MANKEKMGPPTLEMIQGNPYNYTFDEVAKCMGEERAKSLFKTLYKNGVSPKNQTMTIEDELTGKELKKLENYKNNAPVYEAIIELLRCADDDKVYLSPAEFMPVLTKILSTATTDKKLLDKIADGLSVMDKSAEIQRDKKGNIIYDKETKDTEIVKFDESIEDYMAREVLPHVPDAQWFFEEDLSKKSPIVKTGAEIPFTRYFYKYQQPKPSEELEQRFLELEKSVSERIARLFG